MATKLLTLLLCTVLFACKKNNTVNDNTVRDKDNNVYTTIDIDNQRWLVQNLRTTHYNNGDTIRHITDGAKWFKTDVDAQYGKDSGAWCYYDNNVDTGKIFGCLYNYYAVVDPRGIAPQGYHIADTNDYRILIEKLGGYNLAGGILKDATKSLPQSWKPPSEGTTNLVGFAALPGGERTQGVFQNIHLRSTFWSSSSFNKAAIIYILSYASLKIEKYFNNQYNGYSVRCVKNIK